MQMTPLIAVHASAAIAAIVVGPVALWARRQGTTGPRPAVHRAAGYLWVTLMVIAATTALFIRDFRLPNIAGYTPIHLLVPVVFASLFVAFWALAKKRISTHRRCMVSLYITACLITGAFTLLPGRYFGQLVFG